MFTAHTVNDNVGPALWLGGESPAMTLVASDTFVTGSIVAASLSARAMDSFDPVLRRLLKGQQFFVKLADGHWRPQGCQLGMGCCCFAFSDLHEPVERG